MNLTKINRTGLISKVVFQRMSWKYNMVKIDIFTLKQLVKEFKRIVDENGYSSVNELEGISKSAFDSINSKLKSECSDKLENLINDDEFMTALTESLIYATKLYMFCTYFAGDLSIMQVPELRKVRGPFYDSGFTTVSDLAMIYENSYNPNYLKNIGPERFDRFQKYFAVNCKEFKVIEDAEV